MRILYLHPTREQRAGTVCIASVDVELNDDVRLYGLRLMRLADGHYMIYSPQSGQRRTATFSPELAAQLTEAAVTRWERLGLANDAA